MLGETVALAKECKKLLRRGGVVKAHQDGDVMEIKRCGMEMMCLLYSVTTRAD
jgi:hypothetical protein